LAAFFIACARGGDGIVHVLREEGGEFFDALFHVREAGGLFFESPVALLELGFEALDFLVLLAAGAAEAGGGAQGLGEGGDGGALAGCAAVAGYGGADGGEVFVDGGVVAVADAGAGS
jgi:hypothetical protein